MWLDLMTMAKPYWRDEAERTIAACLHAFFPRHYRQRRGRARMSFGLPPEAVEWRDKARAFVDKELIPWEVEAEMNEGRIPEDAGGAA